jgi:uncharacterized membrane protein
MFDLVDGLPVHPLVVHAVVVLLPLAVLGTLAIAVKPTWRATYGWLVVGIAAVATVLVPVATSSGEALEERVGDPGEHAELGDQLIWFAIALLLFSFLMVYLDRRRAAGKPAVGPSALPTVVTVLAVVAALATTVQVYRVGDSGARAAWGDKVGSSSSAP